MRTSVHPRFMTPASRNPHSRRRFLRASGAVFALPWLECFAAPNERPEVPRRMIAICSDLGVIPESWFPTGSGRSYQASEYLRVLAQHRKRFTVFSGLSHPEVVGGHKADACFLTGAPHPHKPGFKNTVSLDQFAAAQLGPVTRFPSLTLRVGPGATSLSFSASGVQLPAEDRPSNLYRKLFVQGSEREVERKVQQLRDGQSLMDSFSDRINTLNRNVGPRDRERLDQYFTAFRELEKRLGDSAAWEQQAKPTVRARAPRDERRAEALITRTRLMFDLAQLAVKTDSTRLISIFVTQGFNPKVDLPGVELPHHALTHQQSNAATRGQLKIIEKAQLGELDRLLSGLAEVKEAGHPLLDRTMVLYGSGLGNAARHDNTNLPILLAGGGFKHGQHLAFDRDNNTPLAKLYVSMLQWLGIEADRFSSGTGTLPGLEMI